MREAVSRTRRREVCGPSLVAFLVPEFCSSAINHQLHDHEGQLQQQQQQQQAAKSFLLPSETSSPKSYRCRPPICHRSLDNATPKQLNCTVRIPNDIRSSLNHGRPSRRQQRVEYVCQPVLLLRCNQCRNAARHVSA